MSRNLLFFLFSFLLVDLCLQNVGASIKVNFNANVIYVEEDATVAVDYSLESVDDSRAQPQLPGRYTFSVDKPGKAQLQNDAHFIVKPEDIIDAHFYNGTVTIKGIFLGYTYLRLRKTDVDGSNGEDIEVNLRIGVTRGEKAVTNVFTGVVGALLILAYYQMGTTLDLRIILEVLKKPISPCIGLLAQCLVLPLCSFGIGWLFFDEVYYRLGLFIFSCSPGGGTSNLWTMLIGANLNLSITMTFISTFISMVSMPIWLYTLGRFIFDGTETSPQMSSVLSSVALMTVALLIGFFVKKYFPSANKVRHI